MLRRNGRRFFIVNQPRQLPRSKVLTANMAQTGHSSLVIYKYCDLRNGMVFLHCALVLANKPFDIGRLLS